MSTAQEEIRGLYHEWMDAIRRNDLKTLDSILGKEYIYTASGQGRFTRQQWMDAVVLYDLESFELRGLDVREYGETAVAITDYAQTAVFRGAPRSGDFLITDVWVRRDGRWQVVARSSIVRPEAG